jgi:hypothetical protein
MFLTKLLVVVVNNASHRFCSCELGTNIEFNDVVSVGKLCSSEGDVSTFDIASHDCNRASQACYPRSELDPLRLKQFSLI